MARSKREDETTRNLRVPVSPPDPSQVPTPPERVAAAIATPVRPAPPMLAPIGALPAPLADPIREETRHVLTDLLSAVPLDLTTVLKSPSEYERWIELRRRVQNLLAYY